MTLFLDTNIVLYAFGANRDKRNIALGLMVQSPIISTQVINECSHVMRRKLRWEPEKVAEEMENVLILVQLKTVDIQHIRLAWKISKRYGFSHFDSLMLASALKAECQYLYSEDMQHGQLIENRLHVINPFLEALEL